MPIQLKDAQGNLVAMTNAQKSQFITDIGAASADQLQAKQDKVATIALSADRPLAATDANNNLTITSARSVTIPTGLGQSFLTHFVNSTSTSTNITIAGTGGAVINGVTNGSVTRSIPANSTLTMRATGTDSYNVPEPATTVRGYTSRVPNIRGGNRILNNFGGVSDGGSTQSTSCMKFEFEAPFNAVRVWGFSRYATVTGSFKAIVAPTETMAASPVNDAFQPKIGGAYQNVVQPTHIPNGSNVYSAGTGAFTGWRNVTWAGSTTSPTLSGGAQETPQFICSDIIPVRSVPRTDVSGVPVGRHAAMLRVYNLAGNRPVGDLSTYRAHGRHRLVPEFRVRLGQLGRHCHDHKPADNRV